MNKLFDTLFEISDSANSLDSFLNENMQLINEFYNSNYAGILLSKNSIESFILLKYSAIYELDFSKSYNKSFALMLLDFCERFNFIAATPRIYAILEKYEISLNSRLQAALLFLYPKPKTNSELVDKFDSICEKIQLGIDTEEDNENKSIATFLNYYGIVVNDTRLEYAEQVRTKISSAIQNKVYPFLQNENILTIVDVELHDLAIAYIQIQTVIDKVLGKEERFLSASDVEREKIEEGVEFVIEVDTDYSNELISVDNDFDSIRSISLRHAGSDKIPGRGVKILDSESELFGYFKSFGNMHKAKLQAAFEALPDRFCSKISIIDWGCGQGFASMLFLEKYGTNNINNIILIEPSEIAVKRASLHIKKYNMDIPIRTVCKKLDELTEEDIKDELGNITVHLFSNILDIDDYSQNKLISLIESRLRPINYFICVSPYIDDIKAERLESFKRYFENKYPSFELLLDLQNSKNANDAYWNCNNNFKRSRCVDHGQYGCRKQLTRVMKVFSIDLS